MSSIYYAKSEIDIMLLFYSTGSYVDALLETKIPNTGNVSLPGCLDIGTTYSNSRLRCHAASNGYTGYAELGAASSYEMFLNLSTTRSDDAWMCLRINNDDYMELPMIENK